MCRVNAVQGAPTYRISSRQRQGHFAAEEPQDTHPEGEAALRVHAWAHGARSQRLATCACMCPWEQAVDMLRVLSRRSRRSSARRRPTRHEQMCHRWERSSSRVRPCAEGETRPTLLPTTEASPTQGEAVHACTLGGLLTNAKVNTADNACVWRALPFQQLQVQLEQQQQQEVAQRSSRRSSRRAQQAASRRQPRSRSQTFPTSSEQGAALSRGSVEFWIVKNCADLKQTALHPESAGAWGCMEFVPQHPGEQHPGAGASLG